MIKSHIQHFSTRHIAAADRFEYWDNVMSSTFTPLRLVGSKESYTNLMARMTRATLGNLASARETNNAFGTDRGIREISKSSAHTLTLLVGTRGTWNLEHCEKVRLQAGDAIVLDSRFAHNLTTFDEHEVIAIDLPASWFATWIPEPALLLGRRFPHDGALARYASQLTPEFLLDTPLPASVLLDQCGALLAGSISDIEKPTLASRALRSCIHRAVMDLCLDVTVTAGDLAALLDVPVGDLHAALCCFGETFASVLLAARAARTRGH